MRRTTPRLFPLILFVSIACLGSLFFFIYATFFNQPVEIVKFASKPDADGRLTFRGPTYQFRVSPADVSSALRASNSDSPFVVILSIDRRRFGASDQPGAPSIVCKADGSCRDLCADGVPCEDIKNGWYRVYVYPTSQDWGADRGALSIGPGPGIGALCGNSQQRGLMLCWDSIRVGTPFSVTNVRSVSYPATKTASAYVWVSIASDATGKPVFVADCTVAQCDTSVERNGAKVLITFNPKELDDWQRFNEGVNHFVTSLIEPLLFAPDHVRQ